MSDSRTAPHDPDQDLRQRLSGGDGVPTTTTTTTSTLGGLLSHWNRSLPNLAEPSPSPHSGGAPDVPPNTPAHKKTPMTYLLKTWFLERPGDLPDANAAAHGLVEVGCSPPTSAKTSPTLLRRVQARLILRGGQDKDELRCMNAWMPQSL